MDCGALISAGGAVAELAGGDDVRVVHTFGQGPQIRFGHGRELHPQGFPDLGWIATLALPDQVLNR
jgi:hypothetical protein